MVDVFRNWLSETSTLIVGRPDEHKGQVARAARDEAELLASAGYTRPSSHGRRRLVRSCMYTTMAMILRRKKR